MPVRQFPGEVTQLPQGFAETERNNPFGARVIGWLLPGASSSGRSVSNIGAVDVGAGPFGCHIKGNNARMQSDALGAALAFPFTVVVVANRVTRTANANDLAGLGHTGGDQLLSFRVRTTADNQFLFRLTNGGGVTLRSFSANVASGGGVPAVLAATIKSASDVDLYWNGRLDNGTLTTGASGTPTYNTIALGGVDRAIDSFADTGNDIACIGVFAGAFSPDEHASIAANPAQVFGDDVWDVVAGAAAGTTVAPTKGTLTFTGKQPSIAQTANQTVEPAKGALTFGGKTPTIAQTANQTVAPTKGALTFTGKQPTVSQDSGAVVSPTKGALTFQGGIPSVTQTANQIIVPAKGSLVFGGKTPTVEQSGAVTYARAPRGGGYPATVPTTERYGMTNTKRPAMTNTRR